MHILENKIVYIHSCGFDDIYSTTINGRDITFYDYSKYFYDMYKINSYLFYSTKKLPLEYIDEIRNINIANFCKYAKYNELYNVINDKTIICDFASFIDCFIKAKNEEYISACKNMFIMDCLELTLYEKSLLCKKSRINNTNIISKIQNVIRRYNDKITLLITPFNLEMSNFCNHIIYYKRINFDNFNQTNILNKKRINKNVIYISQNDIQELRESLTYIKNTNIKDFVITTKYNEIFNYSTYIYYRKPSVIYIEQMGRIIFELKHYNYDVILTDTNKKKTGKDWYLEYYKTNSSNIYNHDFLDIIKYNIQEL